MKLTTIITLVVAIIASGTVAEAKTLSRSKTKCSRSTSQNKTGSSSGLRFIISNQSKAKSGCYSYLYTYAEGDTDDLPEKDIYQFNDFWRFPKEEDDDEEMEELVGPIYFLISLPESFPSDVVKKAVLTKANGEVESLFSFLDEENIYKKVKTSTDYSYNSTANFIQKWKEIFNILSRNYSIPEEEYYDVGGYLTFVCNQIYEDSNYVSYVFFQDHGLFRMTGNGGFFWDYVTYEKSTGKILKFSDINFTNGKEVLKQKLQAAYKTEAKAKEVAPERITGNTLLKEFTSVALVDGGILFHYPIYALGFGYEGQYNLFVPGELSGQ